jgi:hypothetical protein
VLDPVGRCQLGLHGWVAEMVDAPDFPISCPREAVVYQPDQYAVEA